MKATNYSPEPPDCFGRRSTVYKKKLVATDGIEDATQGNAEKRVYVFIATMDKK